MDPQNQDQSTVVPAPDDAAVAPPAVDTRQEVAERLLSGKNVLVTVGTNPTVDELASALGLTIVLNKLGKHVTAVFSGEIPQAMEFLAPESTFENSVDSLRDFIIALSKEKADKLRYKVEDEVVKIFITPYKTVLSEKDLEFSQGDFNVDIILALGVEKREELDQAIIAHGRILHDATVITVNAGPRQSTLGTIDWNDATASSIAEMLVSLSTALGENLLDEPASTAFLTGIVAETNRFSNEKTSPRIMTLAAQLMAAGANQQLIATNLRQEGMISEPVRTKSEDQPHDDDGEMVLEHEDDGSQTPAESGKKAQAKTSTKASAKKPAAKKAASAKQPVKSSPEATEAAKPNPSDKQEAATQLESALEAAVEPAQAESTPAESVSKPVPLPPPVAPASEPKPEPTLEQHQPKVIQPLPETEPVIAPEPVAPEPAVALPPLPTITPEPSHTPIDPPTFGGTLNATTASAEEDRVEQSHRDADVNNVALEHDNGETSESDQAEESVLAARQAVEAAGLGEPFNPANQPLESIGSTPLPSLDTVSSPDTGVSSLQTAPAPSVAPSEPSPIDDFMQPHAAVTAPQPDLGVPTPASLPPLPSAGALPPLPPLPTGAGGALPPLPPMPGQASSDPAVAMQPQINPAFAGDLPQSPNQWSQAGQELAQQQSAKQDAREQKADQMNQQYDAAVDRNRELQGLPPLNDPNGSGLPPVPPAPPTLGQ